MENANFQSLPKIKIATILAYLAIIFALIFLFINSPVTGYELSIYTPIPLFWGFIFIAIIISISLLLYQVFRKSYDNFFYILLALVLSFFIILTLPISRGYYLYGSNDLLGHFSRIVGIANTGSIGTDNYYPIVHIFGAEIIILSKYITAPVVTELIPPIFSVISSIFIYYLALSVFKRIDYSIMAVVLSFILLYSYYHVILYPHAISIFLLPLVFYLYFNSQNNTSYKILLLIALVLQVFVHVIPALIIFGCILCAEIIKIIFNRTIASPKFNISFNSAIISIVVFFLWWSSYSIFGQMNRAVTWLVGESQTIPRQSEVESVINLGQQYFIELLIKMYGSQLILTILTLISIIIMLMIYIKRKEDVSNSLILSGILLSSALIYILYFLTSGMATIGRFFGANYGVWAMPVVVAFIFTKFDKSKIKFLIITLVIIILIIISTLSIYRSEWIYQPNWQVTNHDINAAYWESTYGTTDLLPGMIGSPWGSVPTTLAMRYTSAYIPTHFGYDTNLSVEQFRNNNDKNVNKFLGDYIYKDSLIFYGEVRQKAVTSNPILNSTILKNVWGLPGFINDDINDDSKSKNDYKKLDYDKTVNFIYSNGEVKFLLVKSLMTG